MVIILTEIYNFFVNIRYLWISAGAMGICGDMVVDKFPRGGDWGRGIF
jgi:hypothetical protein